MKIADIISRIFRRGSNIIEKHHPGLYNTWYEHRQPFAKIVFNNIIDLLIDICNDVEYINSSSTATSLFLDFKRFFDVYGKIVLTHIFYNGFEVIGYSKDFRNIGFCHLRILTPDEYSSHTTPKGDTIVIPHDPDTDVFIMKSTTFDVFKTSDYVLLKPWLAYLDNCMNASNTSASRLGSILIMSPQPSQANMGMINKQQRENMEQYILDNYGPLANQKQILVLGQSMKTETISLANLDTNIQDKIRMAILVICDRIKVPANQVSIIDANTSKSLANGSEMRQGDLQKYQSFERLLYQTFGVLSEAMGLDVNYMIHNKPTATTGNGQNVNTASYES